MNHSSIVLNYISFGTNNGKGMEIFERFNKIFETKAYFPHLDNENTIYLTTQCVKLKTEPDSIEKFTYFTSKGINLELGTNFFMLRELNKTLNLYTDRKYFDISKTNLPKNQFKKNKIKQFYPNEYFFRDLTSNLKDNLQWEVSQSKNHKNSLDYKNKVISIDKTKGDKEAIKKLIITTASLYISPTQKQNDYIKENQKAKKEAMFFISLITNAILKRINIKDEINISPEYKKNYEWGKEDTRVLKIEKILNGIDYIIKNLDIEKAFNQNYTAQKTLKEKKNSFKGDTLEEYNKYKHEQINQLSEEIKNIPIEDIISDYVELKKAGANLKCCSPFRNEDTPSFVVSPTKQIATDFGNANKTYSSINFVMEYKNISFPEAVKEIANNHNLNFIDESYEDFKNRQNPNAQIKTKTQTDELDPMQEYKTIEKQSASPTATIDKKHTRILMVEDINNHQDCVEYLKNSRGIEKFPPELKYIEGGVDKLDEQGNLIEKNAIIYKGIGYVNNSGGADIRFPKDFSKDEQWKKSRTVGNKDFVIINKHLLSDETKVNTFVLAESGWDYAASYNQEKIKKQLEKSVGIILNGTSSQKAIDFINQYKSEETNLIILNQADEPNIKSTIEIIMGTEIQDFTQIKYTDEDFEQKTDVNDLHKKGEDISSRFYGSYTL